MAVLEVPLLSGLRVDMVSLEQVRWLWQEEARRVSDWWSCPECRFPALRKMGWLMVFPHPHFLGRGARGKGGALPSGVSHWTAHSVEGFSRLALRETSFMSSFVGVGSAQSGRLSYLGPRWSIVWRWGDQGTGRSTRGKRRPAQRLWGRSGSMVAC